MSINLVSTFSIVRWFDSKKGQTVFKRVVINKATGTKQYIELDDKMALKLKMQAAYGLVK